MATVKKVSVGRDWVAHLLQGMIYAPVTGLIGAMSGAAIDVVANAGSGITLTTALGSTFAIFFVSIGITVGLAYGIRKGMADEDAQES